MNQQLPEFHEKRQNFSYHFCFFLFIYSDSFEYNEELDISRLRFMKPRELHQKCLGKLNFLLRQPVSEKWKKPNKSFVSLKTSSDNASRSGSVAIFSQMIFKIFAFIMVVFVFVGMEIRKIVLDDEALGW